MLVLVYIAGVIVFSNLQLLGRSQAVSASDLTGPTLPVVCIDVNGSKVNRMNGYLMEMDARNMRGALIPMTTKRSITVSYKPYHNTIRSVSYEVSTPDTGEVVENAKIGNFQSDGDYMTATFTLSHTVYAADRRPQHLLLCPRHSEGGPSHGEIRGIRLRLL